MFSLLPVTPDVISELPKGQCLLMFTNKQRHLFGFIPAYLFHAMVVC